MKQAPKMTRIKNVLTEHLDYLRDTFNVRELGIFGSVLLKGETTAHDIDVLVDFSEKPDYFTFLELESYLEELLGKKVDLVMKSSLRPVIGARVLQEVVYV